MKKSMRDSLIAAAALIVGGTILSTAAFGRLDFDYEKLDTEDYREKRYEVKEDFSSIRIDGRECSVRLAPSEDGKCSVICRETDQATNRVSVENGQLTVKHEYKRHWFQLVGVSLDLLEITVMLPEESYDRLEIGTASGDIEVPQGFTFTEAEIGSASGDAAFYAQTRGALKLSSTSGDLAMDGIRAKSLSAGTTSGELVLSSAKVLGEVSVSTTSGDIELKSVRCKELRTESVSGDTELTDVIAEGRLEAGSTSGEISFDGCDAATLRIESTSGDVGGTLLSPKRFEADATSGEVRAPYDEDGGLCKVSTTSGDIFFRIEKE